MAITIIKGGKNEFVGHCKWCGCDFRYTEEDVKDHNVLERAIGCPFCKRSLKHQGEFGTSETGWCFSRGGYDQQNALAMAAQQFEATKCR